MPSSIKRDYVSLLNQVSSTLDALIYDIETNALHNPDLRKESLDMAMDCVPTLRHIKEARKQIQISLDVYDI